MNERLIGQVLAIFFILVAMAYMLNGKGLAAKVAGWPLRALRAILRPVWRRVRRLLSKANHWAGAQIEKGARWFFRKLWSVITRSASFLWRRIRGLP